MRPTNSIPSSAAQEEFQVYFQVQIQFQVQNQIAKLIRERGWKSDPSSLLSHGATNSLHALSALEIRFGKMGEARVGMHTGVDRSPNWCGPKPEKILLKALEPELAGIQCAGVRTGSEVEVIEDH